MSFNLDDPLAGILSDGSDDSFFDDDILGKKKPLKKKTTPIAEKKNALFDLGDGDKKISTIASDKKEVQVDSSANLNKSPTPYKRTLSKESIKIPPVDHKATAVTDKLELGKSPSKTKISASADKLDILSEFTDTKINKNVEKGKSSQSLLDDILGGPSTKPGPSSQTIRPVTAGKSQEFDFDSILRKTETKPSTLNKSITLKPTETVKDEKQLAPSKKKSSDDWLGIFNDNDTSENLADDTNMPAWLVGSDTKKKKAEDKKTTLKTVKEQEPTKETQEEHQSNTHAAIHVEEIKKDFEPNIDQLTKMVSSSSGLQGSNEDIAAGGATLYLQQQESQLMVALQLKAQEEKLATLQMRQKESQRVQREAALAQHAQLDTMLRRQAENRHQMQNIIAAHQERITQRIKALLGTDNEDVNNSGDDIDHTAGESKETPHSREKKQLLQLVQSLQENHDKEIDLMETSYRRQLAFLEISLNQSEERMKEETDKQVKFYTEKIHWLEEHHQLYKTLTENNLLALSERHKAENEMLRQQHLENIKVLQEHHVALMENIRNAVKQEQVLIQDSAAFSLDLKELVSDVKESRNECHDLVTKVTALTETAQNDVDRRLETRESQINDMIQQLQKERANFEIEKTENREIVKMLESRLKQMTMMIEEESVSLKQKRMEFEFEKATFNKQTEFAKNVLKTQEEEIKMLRNNIQKEYQEKSAQIEEEKARAIKESTALTKEKSSIQNLRQELEKMKAELQAQLEEATEERSKLNVEKQEMHMEEQRILAKTRDLDLLAKTAIEKQSQADKKYSEAEFIQRKYEERIRRIQEHVVSLNSREKQIAKEKVALSRERLTLHNERKQIESRQQCSLCKSSQNVPQYYESSYPLPESFHSAPVSRDYRSANATTAMSAIEMEMAHLMGRNFNLRYGTGVNLSNYDERYGDEDCSVRNIQADDKQLEPGTINKDYMDPKFMMLRLDVQKVLSNMDQTKKDHDVITEDINEEA